MDTIQECFGWAAACLTVCYFIAPVIHFINVLKGSLYFEETPAIFVTTCYVNCCLWYIYGDLIFCDQMKIAYMISAFVGCIMILIYLIYELKKYLLDAILNTLILVTGTWACYRALTLVVDDDKVVGKMCIASNVVVYISPIQILYKVLKDKNYNIIPVYPAFVYFFACISWAFYGICVKDFYVVFPNIIGIIIYVLQIIVYFKYKIKYPSIGEKDFSATIGVESDPNEENKKEENEIKIEEDNQSGTQEKPVKIVSKVDA